MPDLASSIFRRACTIHLRQKPNIHVFWAAFEEENGTFTRTRTHTHTHIELASLLSYAVVYQDTPNSVPIYKLLLSQIL